MHGIIFINITNIETRCVFVSTGKCVQRSWVFALETEGRSIFTKGKRNSAVHAVSDVSLFNFNFT